MKKQKILWGLFALFVISIISLAGVLYAYKGDPNVKGPNYNAQVHEQLKAAIESGDYEAWIKIRKDNNLPTKGRIFQVINKDNFHKYAELHRANMAGDTSKAESIRAELGLGQGAMKKGNDQTKNQFRKNNNLVNSGSNLRKNFVDTNNDGLCDNCGKARN